MYALRSRKQPALPMTYSKWQSERLARIRSEINHLGVCLFDLKRYLQRGYGLSGELHDKMRAYSRCSKDYKEVRAEVDAIRAKLKH